MASRQTAIIATSCSIWPHEILAFTTSAFPSFYSLYILSHFQVFTVQSHAAQLTALCADAAMWVTPQVSYFHFRLFFVMEKVGGGSDVFVYVFVKGHALIHSGKWEGHDFFRRNFLKHPPPPIKAYLLLVLVPSNCIRASFSMSTIYIYCPYSKNKITR